MKKLLFSLLSLLFCVFLFSCGEVVSPYEVALEFSKTYGRELTVFSPSISEGEQGRVDGDFLSSVLGFESDVALDFAVGFSSSLDCHFEFGVVRCKSAYDAVAMSEQALARISFVRSVCSSSGTVMAGEPFVLRYGNTVVYAIVDDEAQARRIFDAIFS